MQSDPTLLEVTERKGTLRADRKPLTPSPVRFYHTLLDQGGQTLRTRSATRSGRRAAGGSPGAAY